LFLRERLARQHFSADELIISVHLKLVSTAFKCGLFAIFFCQSVLVLMPAVPTGDGLNPDLFPDTFANMMIRFTDLD